MSNYICRDATACGRSLHKPDVILFTHSFMLRIKRNAIVLFAEKQHTDRPNESVQSKMHTESCPFMAPYAASL